MDDGLHKSKLVYPLQAPLHSQHYPISSNMFNIHIFYSTPRIKKNVTFYQLFFVTYHLLLNEILKSQIFQYTHYTNLEERDGMRFYTLPNWHPDPNRKQIIINMSFSNALVGHERQNIKAVRYT